MIESLTSLAVQYKDGEWDVWCVVDDVCSDILDRDKLQSKYSFNKLNIRDLVYSVDLFAHCASARLWVPQVLTQYKHFLYMDSDVIATKSIEPALRQMEEHKEVGIFMAEEVVSATCPGCGEYASRQVKAGVNGYNSGVLGINSDVWINSGTRDHIFGILVEAKEGKFQLRMGDQDILNLLAKRNILTLQDFPCEFNVRYEADCKEGSDWGMPVILHGSRKMFGGRWKRAHHRLMRQANTMVYAWTDDQRLATSLWEATQMNFTDLYDDCTWDRKCFR
jgi:lipopolysaccharide biosynthesis glycosyltransferase